jgi:diacylglycerol O-acyltransferase
MVQRHMDRLSAVDATFLHQEKATSHMHIGGLVICDGPPPSHQDFIDHLTRRLDQVPRYRQKLALPPLQTGRPLWVDDPTFNIEYHVRHTALPAPGDEPQLLRLVSRISSQRLDRSKPLWELWLVEGLSDGRFAIISKTHHSLVDGVSGSELLTVLFDLMPDAAPSERGTSWVPQPQPSTVELLAAGARDLAGTALGLARGLLSGMRKPGELPAAASEVFQGLGEVAWSMINAAPPTPFNVPIGPHRRFTIVRARLEDMKTVKNAFGGTVNDVVLAVVAGSLQNFLTRRGVRTEGLVLRACVPVSIRPEGTGATMGNQITIMLAPLPVYISDPVLRLRAVSESMKGLKESKQAVGANLIAAAQNFAPPTILAQASRIGFSSRMYNLLVTNVPGPQFPVYLLGRRLRELFPIAFLANDHTLAIAVMSYDGGINFGLLGDYDALPDIELIAEGIEDALAELLDLATGGTGRRVRKVRAAATASNGSNGRRAGTADGRRRRTAGTRQRTAG